MDIDIVMWVFMEIGIWNLMSRNSILLYQCKYILLYHKDQPMLYLFIKLYMLMNKKSLWQIKFLKTHVHLLKHLSFYFMIFFFLHFTQMTILYLSLK